MANKEGVDAVVHSHTLSHRQEIHAHRVAKLRHLVDKRDPGGKNRIRCVLDHRRGLAIGLQDRSVNPGIETGNPIHGIRVAPEHDPVRHQEALDCPPLLQELRIGNQADAELGAADALDQASHPFGRAHRDSALDYDNRIRLKELGNLLHGRFNLGEIGLTVGVLGRAYGQEYELRSPHALRGIAGVSEAPHGQLLGDQLIEPGLVERDPPGPKVLEVRRVGLEADNPVAHLRKAGHSHQADIAQADNRDPRSGSLRCHLCSTLPSCRYKATAIDRDTRS